MNYSDNIMKNRIQIDGVWYVREEQEPIKIDPFDFLGCTHEGNKYCWTATRLMMDNGEFYDDIDIKFTDKRVDPWKKEYWDHTGWMKGVLENNPESMVDAHKSMCEEGIKEFQAFLQHLKDKGWI